MEGAIKYDREASAEGETSVAKLLRWVSDGASVLEMGPATGVMTKLLQQKKCMTTCIEIDPEAAVKAAGYCSEMIIANLNEESWKRTLSGKKFDYIIFADVLEHLYDPQSVLHACKDFLKDTGSILISIPNIGYQGVIAELLQGRFDYRRDGLMDETHIRFFTRRSLEKLIQQAGFHATEWDRTTLKPEFSEFKLLHAQLGDLYRQLLNSIPDGTTYQFLTRIKAGEAKTAPISSTPIYETQRTGSLTTQLFYDTGAGFNERESVVKIIDSLEGSISVSFEIPHTISAIRFDPVDILRSFTISSLSIESMDGNRVTSWQKQHGEPLIKYFSIHDADELFIEGVSVIVPRSNDPHIIYSFEKTSGVRVSITFGLNFYQELSLAIASLLAQKEALFGDLELQAKRFRETIASHHQETAALQAGIAKEAARADDTQRHAEALHAHLDIVELERQQLGICAHDLRGQIHRITTSTSWKITAPVRAVSESIRLAKQNLKLSLRKAKASIIHSCGKDPFIFKILSKCRITRGFDPYEIWRLRFEPTQDDLAKQRSASESIHPKPRFSVILPVYKTHLPWLRDAIESVRKQSYPFWELCIADDHSDSPGIRSILSAYANEDARIKYTTLPQNGHIVKSSNAALALATGDFIVLLDHDDQLALHALFSLAQCIQNNPAADILYSDEDKILQNGQRTEPTCKPEWSPEYFMSVMYTGHISAYRRSLVERVGGFREGFEGSQDYDLMLRATEQTKNILHIPDILYHWRAHHGSVAGNPDSKPYAYEVAKKALLESLHRKGFQDAAVKDSRWRGLYRVIYNTEKTSRDAAAVFKATPQNAPHAAALLGMASEISADRVIVCQDGVSVTEEMLKVLCDKLENPEIGCAGALLIDAHGGVVSCGFCFFDGKILPNFKGAPSTIPGYRGRLVIPSNVSLLSSICLVFRRSLLKTVRGSYTTLEGLTYALCLEAQKQGLRCVVDPTVKLKVNTETTPAALTDIQELKRNYPEITADPYLPKGFTKLPSKGFPFQ